MIFPGWAAKGRLAGPRTAIPTPASATAYGIDSRSASGSSRLTSPSRAVTTKTVWMVSVMTAGWGKPTGSRIARQGEKQKNLGYLPAPRIPANVNSGPDPLGPARDDLFKSPLDNLADDPAPLAVADAGCVSGRPIPVLRRCRSTAVSDVGTDDNQRERLASVQGGARQNTGADDARSDVPDEPGAGCRHAVRVPAADRSDDVDAQHVDPARYAVRRCAGPDRQHP